MPSIHSIGFDLTDCRLREQSRNHRCWVSDDAVAHLLQYNDGPIDWPFDLTDPDAARFFYFNQCNGNNGVMLDCDVITVAGGTLEALRGLFKYHAPHPPKSLGMAYVGILWIPFATCRFQINAESMELGDTGFREAMVMATMGDAWPKPEQQGELPRIENDEQLQAMYDAALAKPPLQLPSDDAHFDAQFPDHPLTKVRARLDKIVATVKFDASVKSLAPFRIGQT
jgi:hypothetical protein